MFKRYCIVDEDALAESVARFGTTIRLSLPAPNRPQKAVGR